MKHFGINADLEIPCNARFLRMDVSESNLRTNTIVFRPKPPNYNVHGLRS
jgi:hypothetical protein